MTPSPSKILNQDTSVPIPNNTVTSASSTILNNSSTPKAQKSISSSDAIINQISSFSSKKDNKNSTNTSGTISCGTSVSPAPSIQDNDSISSHASPFKGFCSPVSPFKTSLITNGGGNGQKYITTDGTHNINSTLPGNNQINNLNNPTQGLLPHQQNTNNTTNNNNCGGGVGINNVKQNYPHSSSTFSLDKNEEFHFLKPPECPVFQPNEEEFKNPLAYIGKIRPFAEKYGIAKIQPPKSWTPPFTVDVDKLKFTPRVQRLNELEAKTRVKLNFLDQIAKFWELQGSSLKIPMVERKALDLYSLHRIVQEEGGIEQITKERKWSKVAQRMGYPSGKSIGAILKGHYERILHPFDVFTSGKTVDIKLETEVDDQDYKPHGIVSRQQITPPNETTARRSKRFANSKQATCGLGGNIGTGDYVSCPMGVNSPSNVNSTSTTNDIKSPIKDTNTNSNDSTISGKLMKEQIKDESPYIYTEIKRMHSFGGWAGNNRVGGPCGRNKKLSQTAALLSAAAKRRQKRNDPLAKYICHFCNRGDVEENMLLCDGCDDSYHTFCLMPPLNDIPKGDWRCPKCVVEEVSKPQEAFGFEQAQREYTLQQFGEMADQFKADYFNMAVHLVPTELVEREFWRIVSSIDEDVTVEYGADLHTMDHGSGFPTKSSLYLLPEDQEYAESSWNLNNLPVLEESILGHINADISGMKVPWMYVGMCFATFCWHNEDHWSYSINYLHWGEPKTWYGVPGSKAEAFEETMKLAAPELFHSQPDLLHQLVTIMNPNILMRNNVPVYRTDQHAGEFVITFPRAYHAGFNQGYNFAEAVNFAPADWMKMGRECINHYSMLRRFCVFSHDELVCKMALNPDKLNLGIATACYLDMADMVDTEKKLRKSLLDWGVTKAEREAFELIPDDERQCDSCKTTCFLSAVTCSCTKAIVCLRHYTELCSCPPEKHTLQYRYTLDELPLMLKKLKVKAETFESWLSKVRDVLDPSTPTTITLEELQNLAQEAEEKKFPSSVILERLNSAVLEAEKCVTVIQQLDINKMRTRTRNSAETAKYKLTMDELNLFVQEIDNLCCTIQEGQSVRDLQMLGKDFIEQSKHILQRKLNKTNESELEQLIEEGSLLCIDLPEIERLKCRTDQLKWYKRIREYRESNSKMPLSEIKNLLKEGLSLVPDVLIQKELVHLQKVILAIEYWEDIAKKCFESGTQHELPEIEILLDRALDIEGELPSEPALREAVRKAKDWLHNVEILQSNENYPYFRTLEAIVERGKSIPFHLEELKRMEEHLDGAKNWKDKTARTFLKKQAQFSLLDVLAPRADAVMIGGGKKKSIHEEQFTEEMTPQQMVNYFKMAEEKEISDMRELRRRNQEKNPLEDKFCICKRKFYGKMYDCQLCKDWFHEQCIPPPKNYVRSRTSAQSLTTPQSTSSPESSTVINSGGSTGLGVPTPNGNTTQASNLQLSLIQFSLREKDREPKFLCPSCMRSRRPRLETILQLLVSLQRLPIRLPEGEALQCVTERAMNWQDRARQVFATETVAKAIHTLTIISQKCDENINNSTKTAKHSNNGKKKQTVTEKQLKNGIGTTMKSKRRLQLKNGLFDTDIDVTASDTIKSQQIDTIIDSDYEEISHIIGDKISPNILQIKNRVDGSPNKQDLPNIIYGIDLDSHIANTLSQPELSLIELDSVTKGKLEDLMMEGDLLEVSLDETVHIWKILNAAKPNISDLILLQDKYNLTKTANDVLVFSSPLPTNKKRRSAEDSSIPVKKIVNNKGSQLMKPTLQNSYQPSDNLTTIPKLTPVSRFQSGPKLKRGRKVKKLLKPAVDDTMQQLIDQQNSNLLLNNKIGRGTSSPTLSKLENKRMTMLAVAAAAAAAASTATTTNKNITDSTMQLNNKTNNSNTNTTTAGKKRKRMGAGNLTTKKQVAAAAIAAAQAQLEKISAAVATGTTTTSTSDDDEECSATDCARPSGREVDWVQCDGGCNKWFHMFCVGLDKNKIKPDDDYICKRCKKLTQKVQQNEITNSTTSLNTIVLNKNDGNTSVLSPALTSGTTTTITTPVTSRTTGLNVSLTQQNLISVNTPQEQQQQSTLNGNSSLNNSTNVSSPVVVGVSVSDKFIIDSTKINTESNDIIVNNINNDGKISINKNLNSSSLLSAATTSSSSSKPQQKFVSNLLLETKEIDETRSNNSVNKSNIDQLSSLSSNVTYGSLL